MAVLRFPVSIIFQRTPLANKWVSERWEPIVVQATADTEAVSNVPVRIDDGSGTERWRFDNHALELHHSEAEGYYLNVTAPSPSVFVMWRVKEEGGDPPVFPVVVTVSYNEAARMLDGGEQVDAVPMPAPVRAWLEPYVAANYTPEPRKKVRRNDPFADAARRGSGHMTDG